MRLPISKFSILCCLGVLTLLGPTGCSTKPQPKTNFTLSGHEAIKVMLRQQRSYHRMNKTFSIDELDQALNIPNLKDYRVQTLKASPNEMIANAIPTQQGLRSYTGAMSQQNQGFSDILCESDRPNQTIASPYIQNGIWTCGQDSHPIDVPIPGRAAMGEILRSQQAHRIQFSTFATKINQLSNRLNTSGHHHYNIVEADAKHMIATAIPTVSNLKSFAGAAMQPDNTFTMILCESNYPAQTIALPYLHQGAWVCGADSHIVPEHSIK